MHSPTRKPHVVRKAGILGVGLDCTGGHTRITRGDSFMLLGGSDATHTELQSRVARFNDELQRRGKSIEDLTDADIDEIASQLA